MRGGKTGKSKSITRLDRGSYGLLLSLKNEMGTRACVRKTVGVGKNTHGQEGRAKEKKKSGINNNGVRAVGIGRKGAGGWVDPAEARFQRGPLGVGLGNKLNGRCTRTEINEGKRKRLTVSPHGHPLKHRRRKSPGEMEFPVLVSSSKAEGIITPGGEEESQTKLVHFIHTQANRQAHKTAYKKKQS